MNKKIQKRLDAQIESKRAAQVVEESDAPLLTSEIFDLDAQETALVEVNFKDESARVVEQSDAPKLTRDILKKKGAPLKTVETFFHDRMVQVNVRDGIPLSVEIENVKQIMEYADQKMDRVLREERDRAITNLLLSKMLVCPQFSYKGEGEGPPIEACSSVLIESLSNAFNAVNTPDSDSIFQVTVRRGVGADVFAMFGESFEFYQVGGKSKKYVDMSEGELAAAEARQVARQKVFVTKMIVDPVLAYTPSEEGADTEGYPIGQVSVRFLKTLHEAHQVVNIPEAGLKALQRFSRASDSQSGGKEKGRASVGE